ncbi:MAG: hypothetical protein QXR19_15670 [Candidatus Jordarchaeaceae archaeon]
MRVGSLYPAITLLDCFGVLRFTLYSFGNTPQSFSVAYRYREGLGECSEDLGNMPQ